MCRAGILDISFETICASEKKQECPACLQGQLGKGVTESSNFITDFSTATKAIAPTSLIHLMKDSE